MTVAGTVDVVIPALSRREPVRRFRRPRYVTYVSPDDPHAVYRIFDKYDRVIYIGKSHNPKARVGVHRAEARWRREIVRYTAEWYPNEAEARAAERAAIRTEDPDHNFQHTELATLVSRTANADRRRVNAELRKARAARITTEKAALSAALGGSS